METFSCATVDYTSSCGMCVFIRSNSNSNEKIYEIQRCRGDQNLYAISSNKWRAVYLSKETALNAQLCHPNVVKLFGFCVVPPNVSLVFQYCEHGSLESIVKTNCDWNMASKLKACCDAAKAVAYLHSFSCITSSSRYQNRKFFTRIRL